MASQIAHILSGERALALADPAVSRAILDGGDGSLAAYFRVGCQGPDIFYHGQRSRPVSVQYGSLVHKRAYGELAAAMAGSTPPAEVQSPGSPWVAYVLGFATHAALDRLTHPFIIHRSGWYAADKPETARYRACHPFYERILDVLVLKRERGIPVSSFSAKSALCLPGALPAAFIERMSLALRKTYPIRAGADVFLEARIANAFADSDSFWRVTDPAETTMERGGPGKGFEELDDAAGPRGLSIVYPEDFPGDVDWANEGHARWFHPCGDGRSSAASFHDLFDESVTAAAAAVRATLGFLGSETRAEGPLSLAIGNGTLNCGAPDGSPCRPVLSDPLPLEVALERQYRTRLERFVIDRFAPDAD